MIQLYIPSNTDYSSNGNITLLPERADISAVLNGSWGASLNHPIDPEGCWKYIEEEAVIKMPSFNGEQLFRIKKVVKRDSGIECTLEPIFYDSIDDCMLVDVRPTSKTGQEALNIITSANIKYSGSSDITTVSTAYYQHKNLVEAINGEDDNAFVNRWGGEILYDNFKVIVNDRIGGDYGVQVMYGRNIPKDGLKEEIDTRNVVTRIYPKAYNGYTVTGDYVDSQFLSTYPIIKSKVIKFEDVKMVADAQEGDAENGIIICNTQAELDEALTKKCQEQFDSGIDKPTVTISLEMVLLQNTELYKEFKQVESVSLGDTIHCKHRKLGIITDARVIELKYDALRKKVSSVKIGKFQRNDLEQVSSYMNRIDGIIAPNGTVMADRVAGILNGIQTQLRLQSTVAKKVEGRAFTIEDLDPESPLYGCMVFGTQGLQISVIRTADGKDWDWTTAITAKGIVADAIITGILTDKTGNNYWNLDTGEFSLSSGSKIVVDGKETALSEYIRQQSETAKALQIVTTRDFIGIPTDADGSNGIYENAKFEVSVFYGLEDVSGNVEYSITESGIVGTWNGITREYTATNVPEEEGFVEITVTYSGVLTVKKRVQVAKVKSGSTGAYRYMLLSAQTVKRISDGTVLPSYITAAAYSQTEDTSETFEGIFIIEESENGSSYTEIYRSSIGESTVDYELNNVLIADTDYLIDDDGYRIAVGGLNDVESVRISLYSQEGELIDQQSITVINEAQDLTSEDVFNLLTDNGRIKGIYRMNDQLYISFSYAMGGILGLGGAGNERGILQLLDAYGNVVGTLDNGGAKLQHIEVTDRIIIYDSSGRSVSMGFDGSTGIFYINGDALEINIPTLVSNLITAVEAKIDTLSVAQQLIANTVNADTYTGNSMSLDGDVEAGGVSLMMHDHDGIQSGNRRFALDYISGNDYALRSYNNDNLVSGAFWVGTNASRIRQVYTTVAENVSSDELKKDIIGGFDEKHHELFKRMVPIFYRWKSGEDKRLHAGFGARTTEKAMLESGVDVFAVEKENDEYSINYTELIPLLFAEIMRLENKLDEMEGNVNGK